MPRTKKECRDRFRMEVLGVATTLKQSRVNSLNELNCA